MKQLLLFVLGVACAEPMRNSTGSAVSDPIARWRALAPTGLTASDVIERIPKAERPAMAFALVRDGETTCPRTVEECGMTVIDPPRDDEGLDAPCLRRALVRDIFVREKHLAIPRDVLARLARSQDSDLISAAADALDDAALVDFLVDVEATGTVAPSGVLFERQRAVVVDAVRRHIDVAVAELSSSEERDRDLLIGALTDSAIDPGTRAGVLLGADFPSSQAYLAALATVVADPHCELSARAASILASFGDRSHLPRGPEKLDPKTYFHEACRLTGADSWDESSSLVATFLPKSGLVVAAPHGREFADDHEPVRVTYHPDDEIDDSEVYLLLRTLGQAKCDARVCLGETARYELGWSGGKLARVTIRRDLAKEKRLLERIAAEACDAGGGD